MRRLLLLRYKYVGKYKNRLHTQLNTKTVLKSFELNGTSDRIISHRKILVWYENLPVGFPSRACVRGSCPTVSTRSHSTISLGAAPAYCPMNPVYRLCVTRPHAKLAREAFSLWRHRCGTAFFFVACTQPRPKKKADRYR